MNIKSAHFLPGTNKRLGDKYLLLECLGDGSIDFKTVLKTLHTANYQGWLVVEAEQDPAVAPSYAYAQKGYQTLRELVKNYI